jgi:hypothetical protein
MVVSVHELLCEQILHSLLQKNIDAMHCTGITACEEIHPLKENLYGLSINLTKIFRNFGAIWFSR